MDSAPPSHGGGIDQQPLIKSSCPAPRKRRRCVQRTELHGDALSKALDEAIASEPNAAPAILYLIQNHQVDLRYITKKILGLYSPLTSTSLVIE